MRYIQYRHGKKFTSNKKKQKKDLIIYSHSRYCEKRGEDILFFNLQKHLITPMSKKKTPVDNVI